jgi:hypothetical protein
MSLKPAIGAEWLAKYRDDLQHGYLVENGRKHAIPRYYKDKIRDTYPELRERVAIRKAILDDSGVDIPEHQIRILSKVYRPVVSKGFWIEFLQKRTVKALPRLLAKGWTLFHADSDCEFVTSDVGILKHWGAWDRPAAPSPCEQRRIGTERATMLSPSPGHPQMGLRGQARRSRSERRARREAPRSDSCGARGVHTRENAPRL